LLQSVLTALRVSTVPGWRRGTNFLQLLLQVGDGLILLLQPLARLLAGQFLLCDILLKLLYLDFVRGQAPLCIDRCALYRPMPVMVRRLGAIRTGSRHGQRQEQTQRCGK
jgi:hypothetical protein